MKRDVTIVILVILVVVLIVANWANGRPGVEEEADYDPDCHVLTEALARQGQTIAVFDGASRDSVAALNRRVKIGSEVVDDVLYRMLVHHCPAELQCDAFSLAIANAVVFQSLGASDSAIDLSHFGELRNTTNKIRQSIQWGAGCSCLPWDEAEAALTQDSIDSSFYREKLREAGLNCDNLSAARR